MLLTILKDLLALFARGGGTGAPPINTPDSNRIGRVDREPRTEADLLRAAMDRAGITDPETRAGVAAIAMGESNMRGYTERGYSGTSNARIRQIFGSRVAGMTDGALNLLKSDDRQFFNYVYGPQFAAGRSLGNTQPGDGYRYRGRGFIQITGRGNYTHYGAAIGRPDLVDNPDLANDPEVAALLTAAYIKDRYKGGGWEALLACVGNNTPDIRARKDAFRRQFLASGEFA